VTPLRHGDMLQDFYGDFKEMHEALRIRSIADVAALEQSVTALRDAGDAESRAKLDAALDALALHVAQRKKQIA
jgi:hypothetical protein